MRKPVAMGFYPHDALQLEADVKRYLVSDIEIEKPLGVVVPHAGYAFSGPVAGATFKAAETKKKDFIIFCPNHTGHGPTVAIGRDDWQTPLGVVRANRHFIDDISSKIGIEPDEGAHKYEHSIEVQLPFLQAMYKNFTIVPICLGYVGFEELKIIADAIASHSDGAFYIASSDFTHFGPNYGYMPVVGGVEEQVKWVKERDSELVNMICKLDADGFYHTVFENEYTVCGFVPIALLIMVMKKIGAKGGKLIKYATSYDAHKDNSFVGYAGIVFE